MLIYRDDDFQASSQLSSWNVHSMVCLIFSSQGSLLNSTLQEGKDSGIQESLLGVADLYILAEFNSSAICSHYLCINLLHTIFLHECYVYYDLTRRLVIYPPLTGRKQSLRLGFRRSGRISVVIRRPAYGTTTLSSYRLHFPNYFSP